MTLSLWRSLYSHVLLVVHLALWQAFSNFARNHCAQLLDINHSSNSCMQVGLCVIHSSVPRVNCKGLTQFKVSKIGVMSRSLINVLRILTQSYHEVSHSFVDSYVVRPVNWANKTPLYSLEQTLISWTSCYCFWAWPWTIFMAQPMDLIIALDHSNTPARQPFHNFV